MTKLQRHIAQFVKLLNNACTSKLSLLKYIGEGSPTELATSGKWLSFLDASKLASSSHIDISSLSVDCRPDFICASFYKIFGYPTGLGVLLLKKILIPSLRKGYFGNIFCITF
jgi:molybdenum cofactor sulfurtransferase